MIQYTFEAALNSKQLDRVILTTDNDEIAAFGRQCGIDVPFMRPESLATDEASTRSVQQHSLQWLERNEGYVPDAVVTLQPTSPLREAYHIDEAIKQFKDSDLDSVLGVTPVMDHPYEVVGFADGKMVRVIERPDGVARRQDYPDWYQINGAIYVTRSSVLMRQNDTYGDRVEGYVMDPEFSVDIDTLSDLKWAEWLLSNHGNRPVTEVS